MRDARNESV